MVAVGVQVGPAGVADQERVAGQDHPRVVGSGVVGDQVGVMRLSVSGGRDRLELGVADVDDLAVCERVVVEVDARALRQVRGRAGAGDQIGQARDVVGLNVRLEDGGDRHVLGLGERDVLVDQVDVGIDHGELASALAAEQIRGAGGFVVEQLAEEQGRLRGRGSGSLTRYQLIA